MKEDQVYVGVAQKDNSNGILRADPKPIKDNMDLSSAAHRCWIRLCFPHFKTIPRSAPLLPVAEVQLWHSEDLNGAASPMHEGQDKHLQLLPTNHPKEFFKKDKKSFKQISILPTGLVRTFSTYTILYQYLLDVLALCSGAGDPHAGRRSMWMQPLAELEALGNTKVNV